MLLQTLDLKGASGELRLPEERRSLLSWLPVERILSGVTGAILGFMSAMVGGALGSAWGCSPVSAFMLIMLAALAGCYWARREHRRGDEGLAEFLLSTVVAGTLTGFGTVLGLAYESLLLIQLSLAVGLTVPTLITRP